MSGKWVGFTEEDIEKLANKGTKDVQSSTTSGLRVAKLQSKSRQQVKKNVARERISQIEVKSKSVNGASSVTPLMMLTHVPESAQSLLSEDTSAETLREENDNVKDAPQAECPNQVAVCLRIKEGKSYEVLGSDKVSLENFQARQKLMEEQNRRRKELLSKALADRKKQTHAEAQRLQLIQEELQKLDVLLSNDVSILRNQIEVASLEFNEAQKRYNKAEKEFLDAKIKMHGKLEQKELLTEHLCTIIEQNEMRKARKLSELMEKLELKVVVNTCEENQTSSMASSPLNVSSSSSEVTDSLKSTTEPKGTPQLMHQDEGRPSEQLIKNESESNTEVEFHHQERAQI